MEDTEEQEFYYEGEIQQDDPVPQFHFSVLTTTGESSSIDFKAKGCVLSRLQSSDGPNFMECFLGSKGKDNISFGIEPLRSVKATGCYKVSKNGNALKAQSIVFNETNINYMLKSHEEEKVGKPTSTASLRDDHPEVYDRFIKLVGFITPKLREGLWNWVMGKERSDAARERIIEILRAEALWDLVNSSMKSPFYKTDNYLGELQIILRNLFGLTERYSYTRVGGSNKAGQIEPNFIWDRESMLSNTGLTERFIQLLSLIARIDATFLGPLHIIRAPMDFTSHISIKFEWDKDCGKDEDAEGCSKFISALLKVACEFNGEVTDSKSNEEHGVPNCLLLSDWKHYGLLLIPIVAIRFTKYKGMNFSRIKQCQLSMINRFVVRATWPYKSIKNVEVEAVHCGKIPSATFIAMY